MALLIPARVPHGQWFGFDKPGPDNTGPSDEGALVDDFDQPHILDVDDTVFENVNILNGTIVIRANNVTVRNFRVNGAFNNTYCLVVDGGYTGIVIEDGEIINGKSALLKLSACTARRLNVHESQSDGTKLSSGAILESCWIHNLGTNVGAHADGVQMKGGNGVIIRANFFNSPVPQPDPYKINAAFIGDNEDAPMTNTTIEYNWLDGGEWVVYHNIWDPPSGHAMSGLKVLYNRWTRNYATGTLNSDTPDNIVIGNVWDDTGELMGIND